MESVEECLLLLLNAYNHYQGNKKVNNSSTHDHSESDETDNSLQLIDAYLKYTCIAVPNNNNTESKPKDNKPDILARAISFCQQHINSRKAANSSPTGKTTSSMTSLAKQPPTINIIKPVARPNSPDCPTLEKFSPLTDKNNHSRDICTEPERNCENGMEKSTAISPEVSQKLAVGQITMVEKEGKTYTRIGPPSGFTPSSDSAFRSTAEQDGVKRLRMDPALRHLQVPDPTKSRLSRSTSVPVSYPSTEEANPPRHKMLHRTGSFVSDTTKLKLKSTILAKTSAALVRKPSITEYEMMQIQTDPDADDSDSSLSEDEYEDVSDSATKQLKRKLSDDNAPTPASSNDHLSLIPPHQAAVITTAGTT